MKIKTDRSLEMYDWIVEFKRNHDGLSPTVREIMDGMGYNTTSVVHYHLEELKRMGLIKIYRGGEATSRSIMVPGGRWTHYGDQYDQAEAAR